MLVLSRKVGETIVIGDQIVITLAAIRGNRVRLGITAPPHVLIQREELVRGSQPAGEVLSAPASGPPD
jgi:carbon storage regulator